MKRRLLIIAMFLLLGAVVNVAVAWGCAAFVPGAGCVESIGSDDPRVRDLVVSKGPGSVQIWEESGYGHENLLVLVAWSIDLSDGSPRSMDRRRDRHRRRGSAGSSPKEGLATEWQHINRAGLPLRCLIGRLLRSPYGTTETVGAWGLPLPWQVDVLKRRAYVGFLPLHPIWSGFAVNTLFYATILWLLIPGPFALRRFLRLRRGLCPKCAYPMGESGVCTECGIALPKPFGYPRTVQ